MANNVIAIASDHRGYKSKQKIIKWLEKQDFDIIDFGTSTDKKRVDHPDYTKKVADWIKNNPKGLGILICGTGTGMSLSANRYKHIRAAILYSNYVAKEAREHSNSNVAILAGEIFSSSQQKRRLKTFLNTDTSKDPIYKRRIKKIS